MNKNSITKQANKDINKVKAQGIKCTAYAQREPYPMSAPKGKKKTK